MKEIISISILSIFLYICFKLMLQSIQIDYKENLTMEEKPIKIILENYNEEKITFTMSDDATVETFLEINGSKIVGVNIKASDEDITIKKEEFTE